MSVSHNKLKNSIKIDNFIKIDGIYKSRKEVCVSFPEGAHNSLVEFEDKSFWFNHRNRVIVDSISNYPPSDNFIIDVGGGGGYVTSALKDKGYDVALFEPGVNGALIAKKRGIENVFCSVFDKDCVNLNSISSVGIFDVLEHIEDDETFLMNMSELLMYEGLIYITVPAYQFLWSWNDKHAGHFRRYTRSSLKKKLQQNGFELIYSTYFFMFLPLFIFIFRSLLFKMGICSDVRKKSRKQHILPKMVMNFANKILSIEQNHIKKGNTLKFGGSILIIAKKVSQ